MFGPTLAVVLAAALGAPPAPGPGSACAPDPVSPPTAPAPVPWGSDEQMDLEIEYLGIMMGKARISVFRTEEGVTPVNITSRSAGLMAIITFRQTLVSHLDAVTLLPRSSVLDAAEPGGYKHTDTARFDRAANKATVREKGRFDNTYEIDVPPGTLDFVALVFQLRTLPLVDGATHTFKVLSGRKVNTVVATVVKHEQVKTEAGLFQAVKVRVPTGFDGKFSEKKPTYVWFSDDPRRVVVRISSDFAVGRAEATLTHYQPGVTEAEAGATAAPTVGPAPSRIAPSP